MKKIITLLVLSANFAFSQETTISLDSCIAQARRNYPLIQQNNLLSESERNNIRGINENWYPKLTFSANAAYQTEVIQFNLPGFNVQIPHDTYMSTLALDQTLYDGGQTRSQKRIESLNTVTETLKNEVEMYKVVDRVSNLYSNILLTRENLQVLKTYKNDIENKQKNLSASVQNGLALQSSIDELDAESLKTEQSIIETQENLSALYKTLSLYINQPLSDAVVLTTIPVGGIMKRTEVNRPELKMLSAQKELLDARYNMINKMALPRISITAAANYGRPGPNFINQELRFFGNAALNVRWNINSLYGLSREKSKLSVNQRMLDVQTEVFNFNLAATLNTQTAQINSLQEMITRDKQIVEKRHNVTVTASKQLENGSITTSDYLLQLNAEMQATLNQKIHEIRLMSAISNYNTTQGINNF